MALVGDDCFFFLNSGCVRGSQCTFRHQPAARSTTIVCPQWLQGCCYRTNCVFRHTDDIVTRNQTPCYYESSTGVCWKMRCAFAHVRKSNGPVPLPPPPVLPLRPPVLPAMPPVLPAMPPMLPATVSLGITTVPPPGPPATNLPLPNNTPIVRGEAPVIVRAEAPVIVRAETPVIVRAEAPVIVQKPVADVSNGNANVVPQAVVPPLTPPPALPAPPKLTELLLGTTLPPSVKETVVPQAERHSPVGKSEAVTAPPPTQNVAITGAGPVAVPPKSGPAAPAVFPKSDHFNEQVRRFKEMLAAKSSQTQKKYKNGYSDEEKSAGSYRKERQRNKKERREKEGYKSHKSKKSSKEKEAWSKADEEILYGDYKDIPLDKKHKRKKHKEHREKADSEPEIKVKSYEEILREKALRKLYSRRKEKFNEDFKELVNDNIARREGISDKADRINDGLPDKVVRKNKKYNSDGDEVESSEESKQDVENFKRRYNKIEEYETAKESKKHGEKHIHIKDDDDTDHHMKNCDDIHDMMLKKALIDSQNRQMKHSKKHKRRKHRERIEDKEVDLIEVNSSESPKEENEKAESSTTEKEDTEDSSEADSDDTDSDSDSDSTENEVESKKEEIIIPDETTNIDFSVDLDDELAMEINQGESTEISSKTKKMSSVVVPINAGSSNKNKYHKKSTEREPSAEFKSGNSRYHKTSDAKSTDRDNTKSDSKKSNDREQRRKSPKDTVNNKHEKTVENKKVVRLVNTSEQPIVQGRVSPSLINAIKDINTTDVKSNVKNIKVKTFEEIMAEKHKRNNKNSVQLVTDSPDVVSIADSPVMVKSLNATLKEKSIQAKLEILNVPQNQNGNSVASTAGETKSGNSVASTAVETKSPSKSKVLSDEEKQKRKSLQLYKPPQPAKVENTVAAKTTELKTVVNTGPRKIIRIRKASLSTDLIDQSPTGENVEAAPPVNEKNETVKVRSFEEIIREKRARQRREREIAAELVEKENAASHDTTVTTSSNNLLRRKPVIRRQVPPTIGTIAANTYSHSKTLTNVATILSNATTTTTTTTTTTNHTDTLNLNTVSENKRPMHTDSNVAKVSPLNVVPQKRSKPESSIAPVVTEAESLENKDFFSRLRNTASRRASVASSHSTVKECERTPPTMKLRKRSVEASPISSNHVPKIVCTIDNNMQSDTSSEKKMEYHGSSRKDIQEALDEERRKREQDLLSDDEFEKEINELGSDDEDENFDDINEDDLMMELEQMIDS